MRVSPYSPISCLLTWESFPFPSEVGSPFCERRGAAWCLKDQSSQARAPLLVLFVLF